MNQQLTPSEMAQRSVAKRMGGMTEDEKKSFMSRVSKGKKVKKMMKSGTYQQPLEQPLAESTKEV